MIKKLALPLVMCALFLAGCGEQAAVPPATPTVDPAQFTLVPFTSRELSISGVKPVGWVEIVPGEFLRGMPDDDPVALQYQIEPDATIDQFLEAVTPQIGLAEPPASTGSMEIADFTWQLYAFEVATPDGNNIVDFALAETEAGVYVVALQSASDEHEALYEAVFIPAVQSLRPEAVAVSEPIQLLPEAIPERDYWPTDDWLTSSPEEQGMDSQLLENMVDYIQTSNIEINSLAIIRHGYLVWEEYFRLRNRRELNGIFSCTKSVTSALVGIAVDQGYIAQIEQPVLDFFPDYTVANLDERKEALTIRHLLTMTDGFEWSSRYMGDPPEQDTKSLMHSRYDWVQFMLDQPMSHEPGTRFYYNTGASHLLSAIIQEATGMRASEFAREHLFGPLGITHVLWPSDPQGITRGGSTLRMTTRDMAKFGYLYLNGGRWDGEQIVSLDWVRESSTNHSPTQGLYYGYQWWLNPAQGYYAAVGALGQYIIVIPELDMVVVFTSGFPSEEETYIPHLLLAFYIFPAVQ